MDLAFLLPLLALVTLGATGIFSLLSAYLTERRRHRDDIAKSTLAEDAPNERQA